MLNSQKQVNVIKLAWMLNTAITESKPQHYHFQFRMKFVDDGFYMVLFSALKQFSPDITLCGWLDSKHQLTLKQTHYALFPPM